MSFTVYGLRLRGEKEVRYIGQTSDLPELRLETHLTAAKRRRHNHPLCDWLSANAAQVEVFKIAYADTRAEALGLEKAIIALCLRLEQRLFNQRCIPATAGRAAQDEAA